MPTLAGRYTPTLVLHPKNPLCHDDAKEPSRHVGYIKEPFLIQKNPTPSKEPLVSQKNHRGSLRAANEPSFLRVYIKGVILFSHFVRVSNNKLVNISIVCILYICNEPGEVKGQDHTNNEQTQSVDDII